MYQSKMLMPDIPNGAMIAATVAKTKAVLLMKSKRGRSLQLAERLPERRCEMLSKDMLFQPKMRKYHFNYNSKCAKCVISMGSIFVFLYRDFTFKIHKMHKLSIYAV